MRDLDIFNRFFTKYSYSKNGCWEWTAGKRREYGRFNVFWDLSVGSHRYSYFIFNNIDPYKNLVCHSCDNGKCVNPSHLFLSDAKGNNRDCANKGRNIQQKKTHCPHGHEYNEENTRIYFCKKGRRRRKCMPCEKERYRVKCLKS